MTNEELAIKAQSGNKEARAKLWEAVKKFVYMLANTTYTRHKEQCITAGVELTDLQQEGYIAYTEALQAFSTDNEYKFTTFLHYPLKNHFNELLGFRSNTSKVLNSSISLDKPLPNNEDLTLNETVPDKYALEAFESVEDKYYNEQLRKAEEEALTRLTDKQANVIRDIYFNGFTLNEISDRLNVSIGSVRQQSVDSLRRLRSSSALKLLKPYAIDYLKAYNGTGLSAWKNYGSVEERLTDKIKCYKFLSA